MTDDMIGKISATATTIMVLLGYLHQQACAQPVSPTSRDAIMELATQDGTRIAVSTQSWKDGGDIPLENTQFGNNAFPGLIWSSGPQGTKSYVIMVQDTDVLRDGEPILYFTLYNIPGDTTRLHAGMVPEGNPRGSSYGPNYASNAQPYTGPNPPPGPKHHYHFHVFALDTTIPANPAIAYVGLLRAMHGHVLASGEVIGLCDAKSAPAMAPPPAYNMPEISQLHRHQY